MSEQSLSDFVEQDSGSILEANIFDIADVMLDGALEDLPINDFGSYRVERLIGRGGMGEVFLAIDEATSRRVAIKVLANYWPDPDLVERFAREIKTLGSLEHPFIARLYEAGVHSQSAPYFVMEFVDGVPLDEYCRTKQSSVLERLHLFRSVCEAVQYAHGRLVLHRDLKPSNILVRDDGTPKLLDFGIAKQLEEAEAGATQTQTQRLTRAYAAPEQIRSEPLGLYTDVYALGVMLYELLAGAPPYNLNTCTPMEAELLITGPIEPERPSVVAQTSSGASSRQDEPDKSEWKDLDVLCLKALRKDIGRRYSTVGALIEDIDHYLHGEPLNARPDSVGYRLQKFVGRNRRILVASSLVFLAILGLVVFFTVRLAASRDAALAETARTQRMEQFILSIFGGADQQAAPSNDLRVITILKRGALEANSVKDPQLQAEMFETLGRIYLQLGDAEKADSMLQTGLSKTMSAFGPESAKTALATMQLAVLNGDQARNKEAEKLARQALDLSKRSRPVDKDAVSQCQLALGRILTQSGSNLEAIQVLRPLILERPSSDKELVTLADSLSTISVAESNVHQYENAEKHVQQSLELNRQLHAGSYPTIATDLANLAAIRSNSGNYAEAEKLYREAERMLSEWYGHDHRDVLQLRTFIARMLVAQNKDGQAKDLLQAALPLQEGTYGKVHPYVAMTLDSLGRIERKRGELAAAQSDFGRALAIEKETFGPSDPHTVMTASGLLSVLIEEGKYAPAWQLVRDVSAAKPTPNTLVKAVFDASVGRLLVREKRYQEASVLLTPAFEILKDQPVVAAMPLAQARKDLEAVRNALREPPNAAAIHVEQGAKQSAPH